MTNADLSKLIEAKEQAKNGVDYSPRHGAICPYCGKPRAKVRNNLPWEGECKVRYHKCMNKECLLHKMDVTIKSIETDNSGIAPQASEA